MSITLLRSELLALFYDLIDGVEHIWIFFAIGVAIEALIRTFKWHVKIRNALDRFGVYSIFVATLLGTMSPLCACGTLPIIVSLLVGGLPLAPAMALLVSAPLMSPSSFAMTVKMLGYDWAIARLVSALFMGIFAGFVTHFLRNKGFHTHELFRGPMPEGDIHDHDYPDERLKCNCPLLFSNRVARRMHSLDIPTVVKTVVIFLAKAYEGAIKIGKLTLIGVVVEVLAARYLPQDWISSILTSTNPLMIPVVAFATIPIHINQQTAVSFLWGFVDSGVQLSRGIGLAFMVGGPVTAIPAMAVFLSLFKKRVFFLYLGLCVVGTLICAYTYQWLF